MRYAEYRQQPRDRAPSAMRARPEDTAPSWPAAQARARQAPQRPEQEVARAEAKLRRAARLWEQHPRLVITERPPGGQQAIETAEPGSPARTYPAMDALLDDLLHDEPPS
jgi:hypothetical protein